MSDQHAQLPLEGYLDRSRFPVDEWRLVEQRFEDFDSEKTATLFALGNGYLGLRGNQEEVRSNYYYHDSFINGLHETWEIQHAEQAYGLAEVGQSIVNIPDSKPIQLYVDDEPLLLKEVEIPQYRRVLDFQQGLLTRDLLWRTSSGKEVAISSMRMVPFADRHAAIMTFEVTVLNADAAVTISSRVQNRQDRQGGYDRDPRTPGPGFDPRKSSNFEQKVFEPVSYWQGGNRSALSYRITNSGMTLGSATDHTIHTDNEYIENQTINPDLAKQVYRVQAKQGVPTLITKIVSYHTSRDVPADELLELCGRTLSRIESEGLEAQLRKQREWLDDYWLRSDVVIDDQPELQQALRWNLFQLAQATARAEDKGIAAKGVTGSGYSGHYFWDTEIYVLPYLNYTSPQLARNALRFRHSMLPAARRRAVKMSERGALFPWRTINGEEASAYYAAGTAQYHINADISFALSQYVAASGDTEFLYNQGIEILIETARLWGSLGFWRENGDEQFHIHGVTGPDEYTTVVNDNLFTNVMAQFNLRFAHQTAEFIRTEKPELWEELQVRTEITEEELLEWSRAAESMAIPYAVHLGIHPQDSHFLEREIWDLENTPPELHPLLLNFHPLVIYRFQVLKQADVVLALLLRGDMFTPEQKLANFEYYDPITTGDSTLSSVVQSIIAAEVGHAQLALKYFHKALFVDLADLHHNTGDGVHIASAGGVWKAIVYGFAGFRDHYGVMSFDPRLPEEWKGLSFKLTRHGSRVKFTLTPDELIAELESGSGWDFSVRGAEHTISGTAPLLRIQLSSQGPQLSREPQQSDLEEFRREDGTLISARLPTLDQEPS